MSRPSLDFHDVTFAYETALAPVLEGLDLHCGPGWTGVVGANGAGKTTLLRLALGDLDPTRGHVRAPAHRALCAQRTELAPADLEALLLADDAEAGRLRSVLGVEATWPARWDTLSHGERKRAQIACALWRAPDLLALDEPTNHVDAEARAMLQEALAGYQGVGLLVSHDRELLDALTDRTLIVEPGRWVLRPGSVTAAMEQHRSDDATALRGLEQAQDEVRRLQRVASDRRREADRAGALRSGRRINPKDHSAMEKLERALNSSKDGQAGRRLAQMDGRLRRAREHLDALPPPRVVELGVELLGEATRRDLVLRLPAGAVPLGGGRDLAHPELLVRPRERVALTGPNGTGKSSLVRHLVSRLELPPDRFVYLPQELDSDEGRAALERARNLPRERLGLVMTYVSRLGSRPERLLDSISPSPGEARKLLLGLGMERRPHLVVMDEPTNHLDLPSIECLEEALAACACALLLVSHDQRFLGRLATTWWRIEPRDDGGSALEVS